MKIHIAILAFLVLTTVVVRTQNYVTPVVVATLPLEIEETSGLLNLEGELWTHNDSGDDALLFQISPSNGSILRTVEVVNADNVDWEDITLDDTYIYIGDVGNNDGDRTDLKIYRVSRTDLAASDEVDAGEISFHYSDQTSFEPNYHNTNFDCEALLHYEGNLYLFTKNWLDYQTNCYVLPKTPGNHTAALHSTFDAGCLITGATLIPESGTLALIGYTGNGGSYTWLFSGFGGDDFFNGESTPLIWTVLSQIEGVCDAGDKDIYISSEEFSGFLDPLLYYLDLTPFLTSVDEVRQKSLRAFNGGQKIIVESLNQIPLSGTIRVYSVTGEQVKRVSVEKKHKIQIPMPGMQGLFIILLETREGMVSEKVVIP